MNVMSYLTAPFNQVWLLNDAQQRLQLQLGSAATGVCQELCWKWIKRMHRKRNIYNNPILRMGVLLRDSTITKAVTRHQYMTAHPLAFLEERYGISRTLVDHRLNYSFDSMKKFRLHGGGMYLAFTCPNYNNEKHSIAFYMVPSTQSGLRMIQTRVQVFDANEGEFDMTFGVFSIWLPKFMQEKYGATINDVCEMHTLRP